MESNSEPSELLAKCRSKSQNVVVIRNVVVVLMQLNNNMYGVFSASIYIREYIESNNDIAKWEQDIGILRDYLRKYKPFKVLESFNPILSFDAHQYAMAIKGMWAACIGLCLGYAIYLYYFDLEHPISLTEAVVSITFSIMAIILWRNHGRKLLIPISFIDSGEFEEQLPDIWKKAKENASKRKFEQVGKSEKTESKGRVSNKLVWLLAIIAGVAVLREIQSTIHYRDRNKS